MAKKRQSFSSEAEAWFVGVMNEHTNTEKMTEEKFLERIKTGDHKKSFGRLTPSEVFSVANRLKGLVKREFDIDLSYPKKTKTERTLGLIQKAHQWERKEKVKDKDKSPEK